MSFLDVPKVHEHLDELFLQHQEALLQFDLSLAATRLADYARELALHMQIEEEVLMPVYQRAGQIPGGPPAFFTGEHQRMREFLARIETALAKLQEADAPLPRQILALLDEEALFKSLCQHHDQRERNLFFPALERVTNLAERQPLVAQCLAPHALKDSTHS